MTLFHFVPMAIARQTGDLITGLFGTKNKKNLKIDKLTDEKT